MYGNSTKQTSQIPTLMKISGGLFIAMGIFDTTNYFSESFGFAVTNLVFNMLNILFLAVICFMIKTEFKKNSKGIVAGILLFVYVLLWTVYNFIPSFGLELDYTLMILIHVVRGVAFIYVYSSINSITSGKASFIYPVYGFNYAVMLGMLLFNILVGLYFFALVVSWIIYWIDTILLFAVGGVLIADSNKIGKSYPARPSAGTTYAPAYSQPTYSTYQTPVQQQPIQPIQSEAPPQTFAATSICSSCGASLDSGERFCTNCGSKVE